MALLRHRIYFLHPNTRYTRTAGVLVNPKDMMLIDRVENMENNSENVSTAQNRIEGSPGGSQKV